MTLDQALDKAAAAIDVRLEMARTNSSRASLTITLRKDALEDLLDWHQAQQLVWRAQTLADLRAGLLAACGNLTP